MNVRLPGPVLGLGLAVAWVAPAHACDAGSRASGSGRALLIGDSTSILAAPYLGRLGIEADARGCRQFSAGVQIVRARRRAGRLPRLVILALGANGSVGEDALHAARRAAGRGRVLALVTPRNHPLSGRAMRAFARRHPHDVMTVDWLGFSARRGRLFAGDGLHVTHAGAAAFAALIHRRTSGVFDPPVRTLRIAGRGRACGSVTRGGRRLAVRVVRGPVLCRRARALAARPPLAGVPGWRWWDWPGPVADVFLRRDGGALVTTSDLPSRADVAASSSAGAGARRAVRR